MKNTEIKNTPKTYVVTQETHTKGYQIYVSTDECYYSTDKWDIIEQFEAEEGAEWYAYDIVNIRIDEEDIEDSGYTKEDLDGIYGEELYNAVYEIVTDIEEKFKDEDRGGSKFIECDEDYKVDAYDFDGEVVTMEVKYKFQVVNGTVQVERVK